MTRLLFTLLSIMTVCGCATKHQPVVHPASWQSETFATYGFLRREPVPYPVVTPYQQDPTANGVYLHGFSLGWDDGLRASFPLRSTPVDVPAREDTDTIWREGYNAGLKLGTEKLLHYRKSRHAEPSAAPKSSGNTNLPAWKANAIFVAIRGIIWNEKITAGEPVQITLVLKNVSKGDVFTLKKFNCNNYMFRTEHGMTSSHGDGAPAFFDEDFIRLKPGEITTFSTWFSLAEATEGRFTVNFHNNMESEKVKPPTRAGIPVINDLEYDFGKIKVNDSNESRQPICAKDKFAPESDCPSPLTFDPPCAARFPSLLRLHLSLWRRSAWPSCPAH